MMRFAAILLAALTLADTAHARPEGQWPLEAQAGTLPSADWVLVIPAVRQPDGQLVLWDREADWTRQWIVPKATPDGIRTVAINGDSEDRRSVSASDIDNMTSSRLAQLARKYNAPAIVLAVEEQYAGVAIAGWKPGHRATWNASNGGTGRDEALGMIDRLFVDGSTTNEAPGFGDIQIVAERISPQDGRLEYRLRVGAEITIEILSQSSLLDIRQITGAEPWTVDVSVPDGRAIEMALRDLGFTIGQ